MARKRDRAFALFGAILFFATSFGFSIWVVWSMMDSSKTDKSSNSNTASTQTQSTTQTHLAGTQLSNFTPVSDVSSLQSTDTKVGTGATAKSGDTVVVDYVGAVAATGKIFQASTDTGQPASLSLDSVIQGWKEGIPGMKVGGTRRLLIPASMAYGANPPDGSGIPANAALVFDVTLQSVGQ